MDTIRDILAGIWVGMGLDMMVETKVQEGVTRL